MIFGPTQLAEARGSILAHTVRLGPNHGGKVLKKGTVLDEAAVATLQAAGLRAQARNAGLPRTDVVSVAFDPADAGRLYASVHEEAIYVSENAGKTWAVSGIDGSSAPRMKFVPESGAK